MAIIVGSGSTVYLTPNRVGLGSTTTAGRDAGVGTATGYTIYNTDTVQIEVYDGTNWIGGLTSPFSATGGTLDTTSRSGFAAGGSGIVIIAYPTS